MARGEPAPRPAEYTRQEVLPGQQTRIAACINTKERRQMVVLSACSSPLASATELYWTHPELQNSLYCVEIAHEVLQLVELQADGTRIEHWVRLGQAPQVFVNCDLMNGKELAIHLGTSTEFDQHAVYAVPFETTDYHLFHGNSDMLYNPRVDPDFHRKQVQRSSKA